METFTIFMLVIIPMCFVAWQMWRVRQAILKSAIEQADLMEDMPITEAAKFALLGRARAATEPMTTGETQNDDLHRVPDQLS
ncbi:MAG: hypothetical protein BroJett011_62030 [Chloroflexota bacterium]|nr:MAG: hypothetical protein BroJett011_62030 [Chloroflexota bacterium]